MSSEGIDDSCSPSARRTSPALITRPGDSATAVPLSSVRGERGLLRPPPLAAAGGAAGGGPAPTAARGGGWRWGPAHDHHRADGARGALSRRAVHARLRAAIGLERGEDALPAAEEMDAELCYLGFEIAFDSNADGKISAADARFKDFGVWLDADGDGAVDQGETKTLAGIGIASINLTGTAVESTKALGEVAVVNTGTFTWVDGRTGGPLPSGTRAEGALEVADGFHVALRAKVREASVLATCPLASLQPRSPAALIRCRSSASDWNGIRCRGTAAGHRSGTAGTWRSANHRSLRLIFTI